MTLDRSLFKDYWEFKKPEMVALGDGRTVETIGIGNVCLTMTLRISDSKPAIL